MQTIATYWALLAGLLSPFGVLIFPKSPGPFHVDWVIGGEGGFERVKCTAEKIIVTFAEHH